MSLVPASRKIIALQESSLPSQHFPEGLEIEVPTGLGWVGVSIMGPGGGWAVNALSRKVAGCYGVRRGGSQIWPVWLGRIVEGVGKGW